LNDKTCPRDILGAEENELMIEPRRGRRTRRPAPLCALAIASLAVYVGLARPAVAQSGAAATDIKVPRLDYKTTTLKNGLKVVTLEDHRAPVITLQVWYRVGSKEEPKGKSGFAHLFEHLMFKGSKNVPPQGHSRYVEQVGGEYNANTWFDRTLYYETVPANTLDRMLFLEADRMAGLNIDQANLKSERNVVEEEYRLRVTNAPYGALFENVQKLIYPEAHPYHHTTIGSIPDLESAALSDVRAFHDRYYKPNNATLVLAGDFKTADALAKITKYFGGIPKGTQAFTRLPVPDDAQTAERRGTFYDRLAPLPMIGMAFRMPTPDSPDTPVFTVMEQILSAGESARLYRSLVREKQLAAQAGGDSILLKLGGIFFFYSVANPGKDNKAVEDALREEVARLRDTPVSDEELTKAKNQALSSFVFGRISTEAKANSLGQADLLYGTPEEANRAYAKLAAVSAADVQRVARQYFAPEKTNVFYMLPGAAPGAAAPTAQPSAQENTK
jgi:zinc protease